MQRIQGRLDCVDGAFTLSRGKRVPTKELDSQLTKVATVIAAGRGPCLKSSDVMSHGIEPGPTAKNMTNDRVATTAT